MLENIRLAFQGIWSHKMRAFLTMLGIIIGIASIIAIVSTIKGMGEQIKEELIGAGNNTVDINLMMGDEEYDVDSGGSGNQPPLLSNEQKEEVKALDHVLNATFFHSRSYVNNVYYQNKSFQGGKILGIDENYLNTCGYMVQRGRGFVKDDYEGFRKVALIDSNAQESLFPGQNAIGKTIEIGTNPFVVVGVVSKSEDALPRIETLSEYDEYFQTMIGSVMIPSKSWPIAFRFDEPENVIIKADKTDNMSSTGNAAARKGSMVMVWPSW
ncbi:MAG: ABC transporter permease, partial [Blautia sp.]|nr:ABC transporter permease [Blautia sp.]